MIPSNITSLTTRTNIELTPRGRAVAEHLRAIEEILTE